MTETATTFPSFHSAQVLIVGTSGSGKTTLARILANKFQLTDIELDALFWGPNWTQASQSIFRERIETAMALKQGWIIHGNYGKVRDLTWGKASIVIWLDYSLPVVFWRVLKRSLFRIVKNESLWAGNRETFRKTFFSKDSILLWSLQTYRLRKRQYEELVQAPTHAHIQILRFKTPKETEHF
ncbi:MAG: hypothetical protein A2603_14495 [Bdellovibrionales bacterium RIFOXYD1_FULL_55_31]|nr:MAG: hypothetical protein A2603_14495 [Bdellovibrionales bacterium RIFOXYD1_FULL_55_31]